MYFILSNYFFNLISRGDFGRLGHGNSSDLFTPKPIKALHGLKIRQIACGDSHCLAVTMEGEVQRLVDFPILINSILSVALQENKVYYVKTLGFKGNFFVQISKYK